MYRNYVFDLYKKKKMNNYSLSLLVSELDFDISLIFSPYILFSDSVFTLIIVSLFIHCVNFLNIVII